MYVMIMQLTMLLMYFKRIYIFFVVEVKFRLHPEEYEPFLSSEVKLQCTVFASVKETKQMWLGKATQCFASPKIQCRVPSGIQHATVGKQQCCVLHEEF